MTALPAPVTQNEVKTMGDFVALLQKEQDALVRADAAALPDISEHKLVVLADLNQFEQRRQAVLQPASNENTKDAMQRWLSQHEADRSTADLWQQLMTLAREAKRLHELNGQLIAAHLNQTSELLAVLKRSEHNTLYGANGQAQQRSGSRIIDLA